MGNSIALAKCETVFTVQLVEAHSELSANQLIVRITYRLILNQSLSEKIYIKHSFGCYFIALAECLYGSNCERTIKVGCPPTAGSITSYHQLISNQSLRFKLWRNKYKKFLRKSLSWIKTSNRRRFGTILGCWSGSTDYLRCQDLFFQKTFPYSRQRT